MAKHQDSANSTRRTSPEQYRRSTDIRFRLVPAALLLVFTLQSAYSVHGLKSQTVSYAFTNAAPKSIDRTVEEWVKTVSEHASKAGTQSVYLSVSDYKYRVRFEEFLHGSSAVFAPVPLAVVALDSETHDFFSKHQVPTVLLENGPIFERVLKSKFMIVGLFLSHGITVYFSEMDIYWRQRPTLDLASSIVVSQHKGLTNGEINIGFFVARAEPHTVFLFELIYRWFTDLKQNRTATCRGLDQKIMDLAVRRSASTNAFTAFSPLGDARECYLPFNQIEFLTRSTLKWAYLPYNVLAHWPIENTSDPNCVSACMV